MTSPEPNDPNQYMIEILNLTRRLDAVTARHGFQRITCTLTQGRERYLDLVASSWTSCQGILRLFCGCWMSFRYDWPLWNDYARNRLTLRWMSPQ